MGVVDDLYTYLEAQTLAGGDTGWGLSRRRVHDVVERLVVLTEDGGGEPEIAEAEGIGDSAQSDPAVQVLVRGEAWNGDASLSKSVAIYTALHGKRNITLGGTEYLRVKAQSPEPVFIGYDEKGRPQHTLSYRFLTNA